MRFLVEVTSIGRTEKDTLCVEADSWQRALAVARSLRGEESSMSGFAVELREDGATAVDPMTRLRFVISKAPEGTPLGPGAAPAPGTPSAAPPAATTPAAAAPTPSVKPPASAGATASSFPSARGGPPRPSARPATSPTNSSAPGAPSPARVPPSASGIPAAPPPRPATAVDLRPAMASEPFDGPLQTLTTELQLLSKREQDATSAMPMTYREYVYALAPGTTEEAAATVLRSQYEVLKASLDSTPGRKLMNLAAFDVTFDGKPPVPPLATLTWKDWRGAPTVTYPRRGEVPPSLTPPPPSVGATSPPPPPVKASAPPPPPPAAAKAPSAPPPAPPAKVPSAPPPPPPVAAKVPSIPPPPQAILAAAAAHDAGQTPYMPAAARGPEGVAHPSPPPVYAPALAPTTPMPPSPPPPAPGVLTGAAARAPVVPPAAAVPSFPGTAAPTPSNGAPTAAGSSPKAGASSARMRLITPRPSEPRLFDREGGEELIFDLFEAMHDLHFLRDALEGAEFCLTLTGSKLPYRAGFVHFYDVNRREFVLARAQGKDASSLILDRHPENDPLLSAAAKKRRSVVVMDAAASEYASLRRFSTLTKPKSLLATPILQGQRILGIFELVNPLDGEPFTDGDGDALDYIAEQYAEYLSSRGIILDPALIGRASAAR